MGLAPVTSQSLVLLLKVMSMPGVRVGEQPRDPRVDEIVRAVEVEGLGVLRFDRLADVRAHRIDVEAVAGSRAGRMQEKRLLKHTAAAQRTLKTAAQRRFHYYIGRVASAARASRTLFRKSGLLASSRARHEPTDPFRISIDHAPLFTSTRRGALFVAIDLPPLTYRHFTNKRYFVYCSSESEALRLLTLLALSAELVVQLQVVASLMFSEYSEPERSLAIPAVTSVRWASSLLSYGIQHSVFPLHSLLFSSLLFSPLLDRFMTHSDLLIVSCLVKAS